MSRYAGLREVMLGEVRLGWDDTEDNDRFKKGRLCAVAISDGCNVPGCPHKEIHEELEGCGENYCKIFNKHVRCVDLKSPKHREIRTRFDYGMLASNLENLRGMEPLAFQQKITTMLGECSRKLTSDGGIDGFTNEGTPIQVKRMVRVDKNVITLFASALKSGGHLEGIVVALSFRDSAYQQALWIKRYENIQIELLPVEHLLEMSEIEKKAFCEGAGWQSEHY